LLPSTLHPHPPRLRSEGSELERGIARVPPTTRAYEASSALSSSRIFIFTRAKIASSGLRRGQYFAAHSAIVRWMFSVIGFVMVLRFYSVKLFGLFAAHVRGDLDVLTGSRKSDCCWSGDEPRAGTADRRELAMCCSGTAERSSWMSLAKRLYIYRLRTEFLDKIFNPAFSNRLQQFEPSETVARDSSLRQPSVTA